MIHLFCLPDLHSPQFQPHVHAPLQIIYGRVFLCGYMRWNSRNNSNNNRSSNNNTHNKNITQCFYMLIFKRPLRLFSNISYQRIDSIVIHIFFYYRYCNFLIIFLIVIRCILVFISIHATSFTKAFYSYYYNLLSYFMRKLAEWIMAPSHAM